jgi:hypothetical protein
VLLPPPAVADLRGSDDVAVALVRAYGALPAVVGRVVEQVIDPVDRADRGGAIPRRRLITVLRDHWRLLCEVGPDGREVLGAEVWPEPVDLIGNCCQHPSHGRVAGLCRSHGGIKTGPEIGQVPRERGLVD